MRRGQTHKQQLLRTANTQHRRHSSAPRERASARSISNTVTVTSLSTERMDWTHHGDAQTHEQTQTHKHAHSLLRHPHSPSPRRPSAYHQVESRPTGRPTDRPTDRRPATARRSCAISRQCVVRFDGAIGPCGGGILHHYANARALWCWLVRVSAAQSAGDWPTANAILLRYYVVFEDDAASESAAISKMKVSLFVDIITALLKTA